MRAVKASRTRKLRGLSNIAWLTPRQLNRLSDALTVACEATFPNAHCYFPIYASEREKTGSLTLYSGSRILCGAYELERVFFDLFGEVASQGNVWYARVNE